MTVDTTSLQAAAEAMSVNDDVADTGVTNSIQQVSVSHGGSLTSDIALFNDTMDAARELTAPSISPVVEVMMEPLSSIDRDAAEFAEIAQSAVASGNELTPSEILDLTVRSQEFMFHSQLTANIANRTADGLQQLFRQQG
jgi:hypothetical protein